MINVKPTMKCDWIVDEIGLLTNVKPIMKCWMSCWWMLNWLWNVSWVVDENVNVLKWLVWGWYNIVLWCMLNQLWDVDEIGLLMNVKPIMECWLSY